MFSEISLWLKLKFNSSCLSAPCPALQMEPLWMIWVLHQEKVIHISVYVYHFVMSADYWDADTTLDL